MAADTPTVGLGNDAAALLETVELTTAAIETLVAALELLTGAFALSGAAAAENVLATELLTEAYDSAAEHSITCGESVVLFSEAVTLSTEIVSQYVDELEVLAEAYDAVAAHDLVCTESVLQFGASLTQVEGKMNAGAVLEYASASVAMEAAVVNLDTAVSSELAPSIQQLGVVVQQSSQSMTSVDFGGVEAEVVALGDVYIDAGNAAEEHGKKTSLIADAYKSIAGPLKEAYGVLKDVGEVLIDAATQMDPSAALAYADASNHMRDGIGNLEAKIGSALLPTLEGLQTTLGDAAQKLTNMDWGQAASEAAGLFEDLAGEVFKIAKSIYETFDPLGGAILEMFSQTGMGIKDWAVKVADVATYPFRAVLSGLEEGVAKLMSGLGTAANALGKTSVGQAFGLNEHSGDALTQTSADMEKQAANIYSSFGGAFSEVAKGFGDSMNGIIESIAANPHLQKLKEMYSGAGTKTGPTRNKDVQAAELQNHNSDAALQSQLAGIQEQEDRAHAAAMRQAALDEHAALAGGAQDATQKVQDAIQKLASDASSLNFAAMARDQEAISASMKTQSGAYESMIAAAKKGLDDAKKQFDDAFVNEAVDEHVVVEAQKLVDEANTAAAKAENKNPVLNQNLADAKTALADQQQALQADIQAKREAEEQVKQYTKMVNDDTKAFQDKSAQENAATKAALDKAAELARQKAAQEAAAAAAKEKAFYDKTFTDLGEKSLGGVGGSAVSAGIQGMAAAGPMGAAVGVGTSLLESSAGFKKFSDSINSIFQLVADTVGSVLEPIVPIINTIDAALQPVFQVVAEVLRPLGAIVATTLRPFLGAIQVMAEPLEALLGPLGQVIQAVGPLIGPLVQIGTLVEQLENIAMLPLLVAMDALGPVLAGAATVIRSVVADIAGVWNAVVGEVAAVLYKLADVSVFGAHPLGFLKGFGDEVEGAKIDVKSFDQSVQGAASSAQQASVALQALAQDGLDLASAMKTARDPKASAGQKDVAQAELQAWFGSGVQNVSGVTNDLFNNATYQFMQDGGQSYLDAVDSAQSTYDSAESASSSASQKVATDKTTIDALAHAMGQTSDPAVKAELNKEYQQAQQQYLLDQDALAVAQDQASIAGEQLTIAEDQLTQTIMLAELQEAYKEHNQGASDQLEAAIFGTGGIIKQINTDMENANTAATNLQKDQTKQALDQAAAQVANTSATSANTQATQSLTAALTNTPSGFNVGNYEWAVAGGARGGGGGNPIFSGDIHITVQGSGSPHELAKQITQGLQRIGTRRRGLPTDSGSYF